MSGMNGRTSPARRREVRVAARRLMFTMLRLRADLPNTRRRIDGFQRELTSLKAPDPRVGEVQANIDYMYAGMSRMEAGLNEAIREGCRRWPEFGPQDTIADHLPSMPLDLFRCFCGGETKAIIDQVRDDLQRDAIQMLVDGHALWFVRAVTWWRSARCFAEVAGPDALRVIKFLQEIKKLFSRTPPSAS